MAITALIGPATKLLGKFIKDKDKQMQLAHDLSTMAEKQQNAFMYEKSLSLIKDICKNKKDWIKSYIFWENVVEVHQCINQTKIDMIYII